MKTLARLLLLTAFSTFLLTGPTACSSGSTSTPPASQDQLQGHWIKRGYGIVLSIDDGKVTEHHFTSKTCVRGDSETLSDLSRQFDSIAADGTELVIRNAPLGFVERYSKVTSLPGVCDLPIGASASEMFEHVWHTFNDFYAFFPERKVDWLAQYDAIRDLIQDDMTEQDFFTAMQALVKPIDDVHVSISAADGNTYSPGQPKGFYQDFLVEFAAQAEISDVDEYFRQELNTALAIIDSNYLNDEYIETGGPSDDFFKWGQLEDGVGYLNIGAFILGFDETIAGQLAQVEDILDQALTDLSESRALVIDVRLAPGGADPIALAVANRFADKNRLAIRKTTRTVEGESPAEEVFISPSSRIVYSKPVVVITSGFSASATETFTLAMRSLPQITIVGEPTVGALSDILEKPLPNGWQFNLANEVYYDASGSAFEAIGIPPDIPVPAFGKPEREIGQDSALNAALTHLGVTRQ